MGKFKCDNPNCSNSVWTSKKVAIVIRGYKKKKRVWRCRIQPTLQILRGARQLYS
ncbi:hypothetical protein LY78DRAFT_402189 [Colletotrichum sublineola]|nr:hypothetical protein LY78DRAFT_402189 [Colletotrichum sublineola]